MSKMDDSNADYLTKYREFIESLLKTSDLDFPLPVNVAKYNIAEFEITGEILNWCLTYLNERNCPNSLAAPLCCKVLEEIQQVAKEDPESCGYRTREDDFQPLRLMQKTIKKLVDVCIYYSDNAKLSTLLPPPSSTLLDPPVSLCGVKNSRRKMEDRHVAIQDLHALFNIKDCGSASYYAIFDGHNGVDAAAYSSCHVHQYLVESSHYPHNPELALKEAFQKTDDRFVDKSNKEHLDSGTTALAALIRPNESMLYVAWLGDSQAVLVSQGKAYQLVKPHRPDQPDERLRITRMGGSVLHLGTWRVNGHLAVSRAIGDRKYKPFVVGEPDVRVIPLTGKEEFLILASDGLWDFVPENEAVNAVYHYLQKNKGEVGGISKHLIQLAKSRLSQDNISVVVVFLSEPEPYKGGRMEASEVEHIWRDSYVTKAPNGQFGHDDDDFGPETDVDNVHDVLSSGFPADAAKAKALVVQSQTMEDWLPQRFEPSQKEFLKSLPWTYADALKKPKPKSPDSESSKNSSSHNKDIIIYEIPETLDVSPISKEISKNESADAPEPSETSAEKIDDKTSESKKKSEETGNDVAAEAEVDSADDSEEEWNYIPGRNNKKTEKKQQVEAVERPSDPAEEEDDMSQLNPNAAEFVPVFGAKEDKVLASSPAKGAEKSLENIRVPKQKDFLEEIATKPSELDSDIGFEPQVGEKSVNGIDVSVDSSKPESSDDYDRSEEVENVPPESFNPFNGDRIQMVSDHFSENQSLDFKPFDIMQSSMVVLDSTPSPTNPAGTDLYDFLSNSDKPDLLSPIDNLSNTNNEQQKSSSSGFESESGNDVDVGLADKCDLVAGIPHDNDIDEPQVEAHQTEQIPEYPETNPFSDNATNEIAVERLTEQFLTFGVENVESSCPKEMFTDDALEESKESKPLIDDALEGLSESRPDTIFNNEIEMDKSEEPVNDILAPVGHVDLIIGTVNADSHMSLTPTAESDSPLLLENNELPKSEVLHVESAFNDDVEDIQMNQSIPDERLEEPKEIELDVPAKERDDAPNAVLPVVDDKSKDDSTEIDDFEIISHDDAGVNHVQEMNGGVHLEEVEPSPDNYKFDDLVQQHIVEVHAENSSFGSDFTNCDIRPPSDMHSILEIETPIKTIETVVKQEEAVTEPIGDSDLLSPTNTDELMQDIASASLAVTESIEIKEVTDDSVEEAVQLTESVKEEDALIVEEPVEELNIPQPELKQEELVSPVDDVCNQLVHSVRDDLVQSLLEASADDVAVASPLDAGFTQLPENSDNDLVKSSTEEAMVEAAASIKTETAPSEIPESLPVTPSAPFSEELLQDVIPNKETFDEVPKEVEQKSETQETQENVIEEIQADDFHSQNGYIADVSTPPSTPAPGVELDNKDGLIAAAVAAAGVASIAAAATAISGTAKPDDKAAKKPAPKPLSSARPSSAKAPAAKPGTTTAGTKKPATTSVASKAPVTATKTTAAKPLSTAKPSTTKPATTATKPASPLTKTTTTSTTAKPKPATTSAAKPTATKSTVGATAKPPTPTSRTAPVASKTAPLAKPKTPTTATPAPIRKPAAPGTTTKTTPAAPAAAKKPELTKPPVSKAAPVAKTTVAAPRPSSASKPTTATTARPTSATKPAARPVTSTTTKMAASTTTKPAGATKPAVAKTPATTTAATKTSTATKAAPTKAAPPKPKPAVPTVLKKPAPADKNAKDSANKSAAPRGPIKKPVSDKTKVPDKDTKTTGGEPEKIIEPLMQEPIVSTTNGHIDLIENGVSHSDESPVDVNSCPIIEAQN